MIVFAVICALSATVGSTAVDRAVALNLHVPDLAAPTVVDSLLASEQKQPIAVRIGAWARRYLAWGAAEYRFGLADGGYVAEGLIVPGARQDCISLMYRTTELARAADAEDAVAVALATRFAGAIPDSVVQPDGRVDYDRPEHLDYSLDMIRSGHWGTDVTSTMSGAQPDAAGSSRYPAASFVQVPQDRLLPEELREGDLAWLVLDPEHAAGKKLRHEYGLVIGHVGIVIVEDGERRLVHAASSPLPGWYDTPGVVAVPLAVYLERVERYGGVIVTRFSD